MKLPALLKAKYIILIYFSVLSINLFSQNNSLTNLLAQNFKADNIAIQIVAPANWSSQYIFIGWRNILGEQFSEQVLINPGKNIISPKQGWSGEIQVLATNADGLQSQLIPLSMSTVLTAFLKPNPITPGSINFDLGYSIGKYSLTTILIVLFFLLSIFFYFAKRKSILIPLFAGLVSVFILLDLRQIKNHFDVTNSIISSNYEITPFEGLGTLFDNCAQTIDNETWKLDKLSGVWNSYAKYSLAEKSLIPTKKTEGTSPKFLLTSKQNPTGRIVYESRGVRLIQLSE